MSGRGRSGAPKYTLDGVEDPALFLHRPLGLVMRSNGRGYTQPTKDLLPAAEKARDEAARVGTKVFAPEFEREAVRLLSK